MTDRAKGTKTKEYIEIYKDICPCYKNGRLYESNNEKDKREGGNKRVNKKTKRKQNSLYLFWKRKETKKEM